MYYCMQRMFRDEKTERLNFPLSGNQSHLVIGLRDGYEQENIFDSHDNCPSFVQFISSIKSSHIFVNSYFS